MIGDGHGLEGDGLGVLEERVGPPHVLEPVDLEQAVLGGHVLGQPQPVVLPRLREEDVGRVRHRGLVDRVQPHHRHVKEHRRRLPVLLRRTHLVVQPLVLRHDLADFQTIAHTIALQTPKKSIQPLLK